MACHSYSVLVLALVGATAWAATVSEVDDNSPSQPDNYRYCTEMDIFAEGQAFDLSVAQIEGCTDISVWNMNMEDEGVFALAKAMALQSPQVITKLDLGYNKITTAGAKRLAEVFGRADSALSWLNINGNTEMGEDGVTALLTAFGNHKVLNTLDFGSCELGSGVTDALVEFLVTNAVLEELWINTNKIGTGGAQFFAGLADNKGIKKLVIGGNEFGDGIKSALEITLIKNKVLEKIDLANNALSDVAAKHIATGLVKNNVLKVLDMDTNLLTDTGAKLIVASMEKNTVLEEFSLGGNKVSDDAQRKQYQKVAEERDVNIRSLNAKRLGAPDHDEF